LQLYAVFHWLCCCFAALLSHADVKHSVEQLLCCLQLFAAAPMSFVIVCSSVLRHADVMHTIQQLSVLLLAGVEAGCDEWC